MLVAKTALKWSHARGKRHVGTSCSEFPYLVKAAPSGAAGPVLTPRASPAGACGLAPGPRRSPAEKNVPSNHAPDGPPESH